MKKNGRLDKGRVETHPQTERGINLDVRGTALIDQAAARIAWHKANAARFATELKLLGEPANGKIETDDEWKRDARRTDLTRLMNGHEEYARFLTFVKQHLVRTRVYRLSLTDLTYLEIMPKGQYLQ